MSRVAARKDPFHLAICLVVYVSFYVASDFVLLRTFAWLVGAFFAASLAVLLASIYGILFGYAYSRTRDLWLPIGLHFGWNLTLPLFGVNVSGLKIGMTGHEMVWKAGALWSGGEYGPEASILTTAALVLLWVYVGRAPIGRQISPLTDPPKDGA